VVVAFGTPKKQILVEPVFRLSFVQASSGKLPLTAWMSFLCRMPTALPSTAWPHYGACLVPGLDWKRINSGTNECVPGRCGPGDFLVSARHRLGLHHHLDPGQGALDARGSVECLNKKDLRLTPFPARPRPWRQPAISQPWDAFYLSVFWARQYRRFGSHLLLALECTFRLWQGKTVAQFNESKHLSGLGLVPATPLAATLPQLINGNTTPFGTTTWLSWAWMFLFGHLVWATGFMFLSSWRGLWAGIDSRPIVWAHQRNTARPHGWLA